ncbi:hypothetical protein D6D06_00872 [Aureobasidium pullulans]|nr:hypothetical protein D6D06_00872 [Aureobasidium pullulans]
MFTHSSHSDYKRSTTYLIYWLSQASNTVIECLPNTQEDDSAAAINTTGQVTCRELVIMARRVASNLCEEVPSTIFRLFRSVIKARSKAFDMYQELAATEADAGMEASNITHKHFIDRLDEAFAILGGEAWMAKQRASDEEVEDRDAIERIIFTNPFSALITELSADDPSDDADDPSDDDDNQLLQSSRSRAKKTFGKGKRGQKRKKKTKSTPTTISEGIDLKDTPLESFRILDGPEDLITDYYIAVTYIIDEWQKLRAFIHHQWYFVTHKDLNSAIAGTLSCLAIGMVRRTMATIFIEFPREQDTYEIIMQTFTRGDFKKDFCTSMLSPDPDDKHVDVDEAISMYAYQDLHDFLLDYQKNRNGKPTKRMQAHLSDWDPNIDLSQVDKKARIAWRRSFTINWLYDLVNVHSHNVRQSPYIKVEGVALEAIPWSSQHSSFACGQLLGVEEFAGAITTLAMQKPGTNLVAKITMWLVFQLQCIVDATTVSRGWSFMMSNQLLEPSCPSYSPRQDIDVFLGETTEIFEGFYWGARLSLINLEKDAVAFGNPARYSSARHGLDHFSTYIRIWLGASKHVFSWSGVPSRFAEHDSNGLWNYSPFLCGTGLMEALEITYRGTMITWDEMSEPIGLLHLHNMASQKGYLTNQKTIFNDLTTLFADSFFDQGIIPTRRFDQAWRHRTQNVRTRPLRMQRSEAARAARFGRDIHSTLSLDHNLYFRRRSNLLLYREADWDPERIPDSSMEPRTALGRVRIHQTKRVVDTETGAMTYEKTELIKHAIAQGATIDSLSTFRKHYSTSCGDKGATEIQPSGSDLNTRTWSSSTRKFGDASNGGQTPSGLELLEILSVDIERDISGCRPVTGLNYLWITSMMLEVYVEWERDLKSARNPLHMRVFGKPPQQGIDPRATLTHFVLEERPGYEECLKVLAEVTGRIGSSRLEFICWQKASIMQGLTCCGRIEKDSHKKVAEQTGIEKAKDKTNKDEKTGEKTKGMMGGDDDTGDGTER